MAHLTPQTSPRKSGVSGTRTVVILDGSELSRRRLTRICLDTGLSLRVIWARGLADLQALVERAEPFDIMLIGDTRDIHWLGALHLIRGPSGQLRTPALMVWPELDRAARDTALGLGVSRYLVQTDLTAADLHDAISEALAEAVAARLGAALRLSAPEEPCPGDRAMLSRLRARGMMRRLTTGAGPGGRLH